MSNNLLETVINLFNRQWEELIDNEDELDKLQDTYNKTVDNYGWIETFETIENYLETNCLDGISTCNFANLFWYYNCSTPRQISEPFTFLGYMYYRVDLQPWKYDCSEVFDGIAYILLSGTKDDHKNHWFADYYPENDPKIIAAVEEWRKQYDS